jgi:hypothetical protein
MDLQLFQYYSGIRLLFPFVYDLIKQHCRAGAIYDFLVNA